MHRGRDSLPLRRRLVVAHEIVDVMQPRLRLGEVGVVQQIDIEARHGHRVDARSHGVGYGKYPERGASCSCVEKCTGRSPLEA